MHSNTLGFAGEAQNFLYSFIQRIVIRIDSRIRMINATKYLNFYFAVYRSKNHRDDCSTLVETIASSKKTKISKKITQLSRQVSIFVSRRKISGSLSAWNEIEETRGTPARVDVPGGRVGCVRAWGLRGDIATIYRPKSSRTCAIGGVGVSSIDPVASRDRFSTCPPCFRGCVFRLRRSPGLPREKSVDRAFEGALASGGDVSAWAGSVATNAEAKIKVRGWTIEIYRSVARVRGRADEIARRRAAWKFYQYRGGHLVSLAVARDKLRAELRTTDRGCRRSTNRGKIAERARGEGLTKRQKACEYMWCNMGLESDRVSRTRSLVKIQRSFARTKMKLRSSGP